MPGPVALKHGTDGRWTPFCDLEQADLAPPQDTEAEAEAILDSHVREKHHELLEANGVHCIDCDTVYVTDDPEEDGCPEDDDHATSAVYVTDTPLGRDDDANFWHHGNEEYQYDVDTLRASSG